MHTLNDRAFAASKTIVTVLLPVAAVTFKSDQLRRTQDKHVLAAVSRDSIVADL